MVMGSFSFVCLLLIILYKLVVCSACIPVCMAKLVVTQCSKYIYKTERLLFQTLRIKGDYVVLHCLENNDYDICAHFYRQHILILYNFFTIC